MRLTCKFPFRIEHNGKVLWKGDSRTNANTWLYHFERKHPNAKIIESGYPAPKDKTHGFNMGHHTCKNLCKL